jgi:hypothetical protein
LANTGGLKTEVITTAGGSDTVTFSVS